VELVANEEAEAIASIGHRLFSHFSWFHAHEAFTLQKVLAFFLAEGVGVNEDFSISSLAEQERRREAHRFLRSLCAQEAFADLHVLTYRSHDGYSLEHASIGPELMSYAIRRWWPRRSNFDSVPYLSYLQVQELVVPLRLTSSRFGNNLATLERRQQMIRITSSGLDQIRPEWESPLEDLLWGGKRFDPWYSGSRL
jgi:hypothetical protein